jgi:hypothetical protein
VAAVAPGGGSRTAITTAVRAEMSRLIDRATIQGPLGRVACTPIGAGAAGRQAFRCTAVAAGVNYPFLGVVDRRARRVTYCKRDEPPVPQLNIPVSRRCRA